MSTRRTFLTGSAGEVAGAHRAVLGGLRPPLSRAPTEFASLCGVWLFRIDPDNLGRKKSWYGTEQSEAPIHVQIDVLRPTSFSAYARLEP